MRADVHHTTCPECRATVVAWRGGTSTRRLLMEERWDADGEFVRYVGHACDPAVLAMLAQAAAMHRYADAVGAILDARTTAPAPQPAQPVVSRGAVARGWERMRRPAGTPEEPAAPAEPSGVDDGLLTDRLSI